MLRPNAWSGRGARRRGETMSWNRVSWGVGLILLGVILILFTTGVLSWRAWLLLGTLWPILLVIGGVGILIRRRVSLGWLLVGACLIVLVGGALQAVGALPGWLMHSSFEAG